MDFLKLNRFITFFKHCLPFDTLNKGTMPPRIHNSLLWPLCKRILFFIHYDLYSTEIIFFGSFVLNGHPDFLNVF